MSKKIEIIDVTLGIDIAEEIKKKVDSLDTKLIEHTREVVKSKMKVQKINKKKLERDKRDVVVQKVARFLEKAYVGDPELWLEGKYLLKAASLEETPQNLNKLTAGLRRHFEKEDKWSLSKTRKSRKTLYRLVRFE